MPDWNSVLLQYGVSVPYKSEFTIRCPFHEDRRGSCAINADKGVWICFAGCGQGSLKYFIWKLSGKSWDEITNELETETWELDLSLFDGVLLEDFDGVLFEEELPATPIQPPTLLDIPKTHWIYKRGFTHETLEKWGCKSNEYSDLLIPVEDRDSKILGWVSRRQQAIPKYLFSKGFAKSKNLFGINHLYSPDTLFVVEGALDAMWLDQHGYASVAVLGASVSKTQINLISTLRPTEVVLSLDNDKAGQAGISKATLDMRDKFLLSYVQLPTGYKDIQDIRNAQQLTEVIQNKALW